MKARRESCEQSDPGQDPFDLVGQFENSGQSTPDATEVNARGKRKGKGKGAKGKKGKRKKGEAVVTPSDLQLRPR